MYPYCNLIVTFDIGACMNYAEEDILRSNATVLHVGCSPVWYNQISYNVIDTELQSFFVDKCIFCEAHNASQTIEVITNKLKNIIG
jgi:hypothetical protein